MTSDYGDFCREMREARKESIRKYGYSERSQYYMDLAEEFAKNLLKLGAKFMTAGVYRLGNFDFYPRKSNARDFRTNEFFTQEEALEKIKEIK